MFSWDATANFVLVLAVVGLLSLGGYLAYKNQDGPISSVFTFAFLFAVLLVCSRFKHVEGFGFKAEMWGQEQVKAAHLVHQLSSLSETTTQQMALMASHLGLIDSGFTNPQLAKLLQDTQSTLAVAGTEKKRADELTFPIIDRIKKNYISVAQHLASDAYRKTIADMEDSLRTADGNKREEILGKIKEIRDTQREVGAIPFERLYQQETLDPIVSIIKSSPSFIGKEDVQSTLSEFNNDLKFFISNNKLRREIDIDYVYRQ